MWEASKRVADSLFHRKGKQEGAKKRELLLVFRTKRETTRWPLVSPPPRHTHAHHTSHLDTWSLTSSHSINSDSSSPHLIYLAGNCTYTFANCGRSHFPRDRLIVCLPLFSTSTTLSPSGPVSPRVHHLSSASPIGSESTNFSSPLLYHTIGT